jgi:hypothetical protein
MKVERHYAMGCVLGKNPRQIQPAAIPSAYNPGRESANTPKSVHSALNHAGINFPGDLPGATSIKARLTTTARYTLELAKGKSSVREVKILILVRLGSRDCYRGATRF